MLPILILVAIAIPSFRLLNLQYSYPKADLTLKATGYQWYWEHAYPDLGITFETRMLDDEARQALIAENIPAPRNLAVDNEVIVPVNKVVNVLVTAAPDGVIHDWTIPSFGSKVDAVPGRITTTWFKATVEGIFYGQCSELCGKDHALHADRRARREGGGLRRLDRRHEAGRRGRHCRRRREGQGKAQGNPAAKEGADGEGQGHRQAGSSRAGWRAPVRQGRRDAAGQRATSTSHTSSQPGRPRQQTPID